MKREIERKIPVEFQTVETYDDRFLRVKIWLMHLGQNRNGSYFDKEAVTKAIPSLANTPILGYVEDEDFTEHKNELTKENGAYKYKYIGKAYGVIPEDNKAEFEWRTGNDGIEREYLTCEGILWRKWDDPIEIMERDGEKQQSMELHEDVDGFFDRRTGYYHFTDFKFFGACILGDAVRPAMDGATVELNYSMSDFSKEIHTQMEDFKNYFSIKDLREGENMDKKLKELMIKFSITEEILTAKNFNLEDYQTEEALEEVLTSYVQEGQVANCNTCGNGTGECTCGEGQVSTEEGASKQGPEGIEEIPVEQPVVENAVTEYEEKITALQSELEGVKAEFQAVKNSKQEIETQFSQLSEEITELRTYKAEKEKVERANKEEALYNMFSEKLTSDEIQSVKEKAIDYSLEQIESALFTIVGKKAINYTDNNDSGFVRVNFSKQINETEVANPIEALIKKHIN